MKYFYSRPCGRGDFSGLIFLDYLRPISTHAPAGGATKSVGIRVYVDINFYSRPCGRGDEAAIKNRNIGYISTHAPAGGATWDGCTMLFVASISTHAPAGGATSGTALSGPSQRHFYSRPCGRGDREKG